MQGGDFNDLDSYLGDQGATLMEHAEWVQPAEGKPEAIERPSFRVYDAWTEIDGVKYAPGVWLHTIKADDEGASWRSTGCP